MCSLERLTRMLQWRFYWHLPYVAGTKEYLTNRLIIFVIIYQCCGSESDWITEYIQQYDNAMSKYLSRSDRVENSAAAFSPFNGHIKTAEQRNIIQQLCDWYTGRWLVGCHIWYRKEGRVICGPAQSPPRCTKCNSPPINGQCTNFILFDVAS